MQKNGFRAARARICSTKDSVQREGTLDICHECSELLLSVIQKN